MADAIAVKHGGNRLTLAQLLIWTTVTAVLFAIARLNTLSTTTVEPETAQEAFREWLQKAIAFGISPIGGAGLCGLGLAVYRQFTGEPRFPSQPGQVLLVAIGILIFASIALFVSDLATPSISRFLQLRLPGRLWQSVRTCSHATATAIVMCWMTHRAEFPRRWQAALYLSSASLVAVYSWVACMYHYGFYVYPNWSVGVASGVGVLCASCFALTIALSLADLLTGHYYDLFHWAGVFSWPALLAALVISYWY